LQGLCRNYIALIILIQTITFINEQKLLKHEQPQIHWN